MQPWSPCDGQSVVHPTDMLTALRLSLPLQVKGGLKAIYCSGWQVAGDANTAGDVYPDQSLYPANAVPELVRKLNKVAPSFSGVSRPQRRRSGCEGVKRWMLARHTVKLSKITHSHVEVNMPTAATQSVQSRADASHQYAPTAPPTSTPHTATLCRYNYDPGAMQALRRADQVETAEGNVTRDWYAPIVADAEAGFGGPLNAYEMMKARPSAPTSCHVPMPVWL